MAATNINRVTITGNLTKDPELRSTGGGTSVCSLRVAVNSRRKDETGNWVDKPNYFDVTVWGAQGENCAQYLAKGRPVAVDGRLNWREGPPRARRRPPQLARVAGPAGQQAPVRRYHCRLRPVPRLARGWWRERRPLHTAERRPGRHRRLRARPRCRRSFGRRHPVLTST